jgi:asparagine synthase (glutamine-hydrolysing)
MCGILGEFCFVDGAPPADWDALIARMSRRGPDGTGFWRDERCVMAFRRLAVLDLSPAGDQPIRTSDGRYVLVINGEVYNFRELRHELENAGYSFQSTGDSQVVLNALAHWGTDALRRFNGMFAMAFFDTLERRLLLARDHAGIKPLYWARDGERIVFASQYDQLLNHPVSRRRTISRDGLALYLRLGYIPEGFGIVDGSEMLPAGTWMEFRESGNRRSGRFFDFPRGVQADLFGGEAIEAVDAAITAAVRRQMVSDVPIGTFLSGGIDSPLVASKMAAAGNGNIHAFTIGNAGDPSDESGDATAYARDLRIQHTLEHATEEHALGLVEDVVRACSEPFADYSVFPTMLVSRLARREMTVMLSGDGGDELFWGYAGRMAASVRLAKNFRQPRALRRARWLVKRHLDVGSAEWNITFPTIGDWYRARHTRIPEYWLRRLFPDLPGWPERYRVFHYDGWKEDETAAWVRWNEYSAHLAGVLLKVDRASMHESLEVRVPLLDLEVIAIASRVNWRDCLDTEMPLGKLPLRKVLARHVRKPSSGKRGFGVPMAKWLRGPLQPLITEMLANREELLGVGICRDVLTEMIRLHTSGALDLAWALWSLLSLSLWERQHLANVGAQDLRTLPI